VLPHANCSDRLALGRQLGAQRARVVAPVTTPQLKLVRPEAHAPATTVSTAVGVLSREKSGHQSRPGIAFTQSSFVLLDRSERPQSIYQTAAFKAARAGHGAAEEERCCFPRPCRYTVRLPRSAATPARASFVHIPPAAAWMDERGSESDSQFPRRREGHSS
jgi:hypothetical protein